ncbi:hypothetical protein QFZ89_007538 [Paraburkholderia youngii]
MFWSTFIAKQKQYDSRKGWLAVWNHMLATNAA